MDAQAERELADELVGTHLAAAHASLPELAEALEVGGTTWDRQRLGVEAAARLEGTAERLVAHQPQRARALLEQSIALDPDADAPVVVRRFVALGEAQRRVGALEDAMQSFRRTLPGHDEVPSSLRVRAALGYEDALFTSRLARGEWGADGLSLIDVALGSIPDGDGPAQARLLAARGRALAYGGRPGAGKAAAEQAVEVARGCGDGAALASALLSQRATQTTAGDLDVRLTSIDEAVAAATDADAREDLLEALRMQFVDLLEAGRTDEAATVRRRAEAVIDELRLPVHLWYPSMWRAMEALRTGDPSARALVEAFQVEATRWHYRDGRLVHAVQYLHLMVAEGDPSQAFPVLQPLLEELPGRFAPVMAYAAAAAGQLDLAADLVAIHATSEFARLPADLSWLYSVALYAEAAARIDDVDSSRVLAGLLEPWTGHLVVLGSGAVCLGDVDGFAGQARAAMRDLDGARHLLAEALERNVATGCAAAAARVRSVQADLGLDGTA
jgi:tetratricopeptide (TPR) repeat protein